MGPSSAVHAQLAGRNPGGKADGTVRRRPALQAFNLPGLLQTAESWVPCSLRPDQSSAYRGAPGCDGTSSTTLPSSCVFPCPRAACNPRALHWQGSFLFARYSGTNWPHLDRACRPMRGVWRRLKASPLFARRAAARRAAWNPRAYWPWSRATAPSADSYRRCCAGDRDSAARPPYPGSVRLARSPKERQEARLPVRSRRASLPRLHLCWCHRRCYPRKMSRQSLAQAHSRRRERTGEPRSDGNACAPRRFAPCYGQTSRCLHTFLPLRHPPK
jgi:hypothetical protein